MPEQGLKGNFPAKRETDCLGNIIPQEKLPNMNFWDSAQMFCQGVARLVRFKRSVLAKNVLQVSIRVNRDSCH